MTNLIKFLQLASEIEGKSTRVVKWWPYPGSVRGPFHRWFNCEPVEEQYRDKVASQEDDCAYAAFAMNNFKKMIEALEVATEALVWIKRDCPESGPNHPYASKAKEALSQTEEIFKGEL